MVLSQNRPPLVTDDLQPVHVESVVGEIVRMDCDHRVGGPQNIRDVVFP